MSEEKKHCETCRCEVEQAPNILTSLAKMVVKYNTGARHIDHETREDSLAAIGGFVVGHLAEIVDTARRLS